MTSIEDDIVSLFAMVFMVLIVVGIVAAEGIFRIYQLSIAFLFALIIFYITRRTVYIEIKKEEESKH